MLATTDRDLDRVGDIPGVSWAAFIDAMRRKGGWSQGEHVSLIGPTGLGKTTLLLDLLTIRGYVTLFASKKSDPTLAGLTRRGWKRAKTWPPPALTRRLVLWPTVKPLNATERRAIFLTALHDMQGQGNWCIAADDANYLCQKLGLGPTLEEIWYQGRSEGLSLVAAVQRPRHVPLLAYSQATHLFFWRTNDVDDLKRIGGLNGVDSKLVRETVARLPRYSVLYVNTRTGQMAVTKVER